MVFEWNCEWLHLPQSAVFNALVNLASPEGMPNLGRGCLNYGDAKITVALLFSSLKFAGFHNQSPLLTMFGHINIALIFCITRNRNKFVGNGWIGVPN